MQLELPEEPLAAAARQSWLLLLLLLGVTAATVGLATYLLVERYAKPLRLLSESMNEIGRGRIGYRIAEKRNDEFGEVFRVFDAMAERLERARTPPETPRPSSTDARNDLMGEASRNRGQPSLAGLAAWC